MCSVGPNGCYEPEIWDEEDLQDWGEEQHIYNTCYPPLEPCSQKQPSGEPVYTGSSWTDLPHCRCALQTRPGAGVGNTPTTHQHHSSSHGSRKYNRKMGVF